MANTIKDPATGTELIWITDAMSEFGRSRDWFSRRITMGKIRDMPQPGTSRIYLVLEDVKREIAKGED